jgi:hypothetical protein
MAVATAVFTESAYPNGQDMTQRRMYIIGIIAISASPATYPAGGIPITFVHSNPSGLSLPGFSKPGSVRTDMATRKGSGYTYSWTTIDLWASGTVYAVGQSVVDTNGNIQTVTTAGTSGSTQPIWAMATGATPNPTTADGTGSLVWTLQGVSSGLVQIFQQNATTGPLVELTQASAIPAGVSGDTISTKMEFVKG